MKQKFKEDRPLAGIEAAVKKLLELVNAQEPDLAGRINVAPVNTEFLRAGGLATEYRIAVSAAVDRGLLELHPSGCYMTFTQKGADLFA